MKKKVTLTSLLDDNSGKLLSLIGDSSKNSDRLKTIDFARAQQRQRMQAGLRHAGPEKYQAGPKKSTFVLACTTI